MKNYISAVPDTWLAICKEARPDSGEDNFCRAFTNSAGLLAVFDGCGGSGARRHRFYSDKTEAFMASRMCAGVFYDTFSECFSADSATSPAAFVKTAAENCRLVLDTFQPSVDQTVPQIGGSLMKVLPSTAAAVLIQPVSEDVFDLTAIWAGDSRVYVMDERGLAQLTVDDTGVEDPFDNLYDDGIMRNIISAGRPVKLHTRTVRVQKPFFTLAATDGCFGYFSTPMEFEAVLLDAMCRAQSPAQWENALKSSIGTVAGDDFTLCLAAYGYPDFRRLQNAYTPRLQQLNTDYIQNLSLLPLDDRERRRELWLHYQPQYMRYLKDG